MSGTNNARSTDNNRSDTSPAASTSPGNTGRRVAAAPVSADSFLDMDSSGRSTRSPTGSQSFLNISSSGSSPAAASAMGSPASRASDASSAGGSSGGRPPAQNASASGWPGQYQSPGFAGGMNASNPQNTTSRFAGRHPSREPASAWYSSDDQQSPQGASSPRSHGGSSQYPSGPASSGLSYASSPMSGNPRQASGAMSPLALDAAQNTAAGSSSGRGNTHTGAAQGAPTTYPSAGFMSFGGAFPTNPQHTRTASNPAARPGEAQYRVKPRPSSDTYNRSGGQ
ncbi:hypothetical protein OH77DRAFT_889076 [Trametes cingulata]|nr:hypothetical protein OH77DRAFT_889076 [Trametes cingulata]